MKDMTRKFAAHQRSVWIPTVVEGDGGICDSKFSGQPWLAKNEGYPLCPNCKEPQQLFLQLNLETLPEPDQRALQKSSLVQLFYCTNMESRCESECEAFNAFSKSVLARLVKVEGENRQDLALPTGSFPAKTIVSWEESLDYPGLEEAENLGVQLSDEEWDEIIEAYPLRGDKLFGYPHWEQWVEYPSCPECSGRMDLLFQLGSSDNLPYDFGDVGTGYLTQCRNHPAVLAFSWSCG